jgi:type IV pilus assembly protein PilM
MKLQSKPKEKFSVGLDIGTQVVKIVKLKFAEDTVELVSFALEPILAEVVEVLKKLKQSQLVDTANIALSGPATVIRDINFPKMSYSELKQALKFEAQKHIPFPVEEVNLDGSILKDDLPDNKMLVLLAAARKDFINQRLRFLEIAGFKANIIEIDSIALINAFNFNNPAAEDSKHKTIALLNIGAAITNVNIIEDAIPRLSRDIQIAGNNLTQKIADIFGVDFKSAEDFKIGSDSERYAKMIAGL